jgi:pimeloyl-ACP methyl ester carboxylesterase
VRALDWGVGAGLLLVSLKVTSDLAVREYEDVALEETEPEGSAVWVNGARIHYHELGQGQPLLLLHGLGASTYSFRHNLPELSRHFRVIAMDLPGYGLSSRAVPDLSLTAQTQYVTGFLDHLGLERITVVGHSMGGSVAQRLAVTAPDRVERLVLLASTTDEFMLRGAFASAVMAPFIPVFVTAVLHNPQVREMWVRRAVHDPDHLTPEIRAAYAAPGHIIGHVAAFQRLMIDRMRDQPLDLGRIAAPALIVWGETDRIVSLAHGRQLEASIRGSRLVVVPRAGHWVPEEQPVAVNGLIRDFVLDASREGASEALA